MLPAGPRELASWLGRYLWELELSTGCCLGNFLVSLWSGLIGSFQMSSEFLELPSGSLKLPTVSPPIGHWAFYLPGIDSWSVSYKQYVRCQCKR